MSLIAYAVLTPLSHVFLLFKQALHLRVLMHDVPFVHLSYIFQIRLTTSHRLLHSVRFFLNLANMRNTSPNIFRHAFLYSTVRLLNV